MSHRFAYKHMKHNEFWAIPKEIYARTEISLEARNLYMILFTRANGENIAWPGQKSLGETLGVGERSIKRYIKELVKNELIEVIRSGLTRTNRYIVRGQIGLSRGDKNVTSREATAVSHHSKRTVVKEHSNPIAVEAAEWNFKDYLKTMEGDKQRHIQIIAIYWRYKGFSFVNKKQADFELRRDLRAARDLAGYTDEDIKATMQWLCDNTDFKWTLETCGKYINENLDELEPMIKGRSKQYV